MGPRSYRDFAKNIALLGAKKWGPTCDRDISNSAIYATAIYRAYTVLGGVRASVPRSTIITQGRQAITESRGRYRVYNFSKPVTHKQKHRKRRISAQNVKNVLKFTPITVSLPDDACGLTWYHIAHSTGLSFTCSQPATGHSVLLELCSQISQINSECFTAASGPTANWLRNLKLSDKLICWWHCQCHSWFFNPRPLRPKGYCRHLCLSVCPSVPIILVNTITQSLYPISPPNLLGGFNMALSWMVL